jgi:3-hydroxymyristoyl/3-hydroxydecanoyl-(acyl carrier protein) dehydratase
VENEKKINLADKVIFNEKSQFSLHERVDHIGKIEGKRVSFTEMEQVLQSSSLVKQAKALMLTRQRVETAGVLVLSEQGEVMLNQAGRKSLITELKKLLSRHFETVVIPKRWRFVKRLPYNSQGKLPHHNLVELFANKAKKWPEIIHRKTDEYTLVLTCQLPADLIYFDGHFEQQGILPGIVQVHWAEFYAREYLSVQGRFKCIEALKFQQLLMPEQTVSINLQFDPNKQKLFFSYDSERGAHSSGRICYE